MLMLRDHTQAH